jgi:hypothetical protein
MRKKTSLKLKVNTADEKHTQMDASSASLKLLGKKRGIVHSTMR